MSSVLERLGVVDAAGITQIIGAIAAATVAIIGAIAARQKILNGRRTRERPGDLHGRVRRYTGESVRREDEDL